MAMQAATVSILIEKAKFDPQVALAIAEAIDNEIQGSQAVTVPVLDTRLADLKGQLDTRMTELKVQLDERISALDGRVTDVKNQLDVRVADLKSQLDVRLADLKGQLDARLGDVKAELVRWVFLTTVGQVTMLTGIMYFLLQHTR